MTLHAELSFSRRKLFSSLWEHEDDRRRAFQASISPLFILVSCIEAKPAHVVRENVRIPVL